MIPCSSLSDSYLNINMYFSIIDTDILAIS